MKLIGVNNAFLNQKTFINIDYIVAIQPFYSFKRNEKNENFKTTIFIRDSQSDDGNWALDTDESIESILKKLELEGVKL